VEAVAAVAALVAAVCRMRERSRQVGRNIGRELLTMLLVHCQLPKRQNAKTQTKMLDPMGIEEAQTSGTRNGREIHFVFKAESS
jgi:hypothetical protein